MYKGDEKGVEEQLAKWYANYTGAEVDISPEVPPEGRSAGRGRFYASRDAKAVLGVCQSCQEYREMGIVTGRSGYGKTYVLRRYAKSAKVVYIECDTTIPVTGSYALVGTGLTVQFAEAADADQKPSSFMAGDTFAFSSTAPAMTNGGVLAAVDKLKEFTQES